jgi:hypothetical protein
MRWPARMFVLSLFLTLAPRPASAQSLPFPTVFRGEATFDRLVAQAEREHWRSLPLGDRIVAIGRALLGTPYKNFTLEIDDRVEAPSVNLLGVDCWTFFEIALGFARMLETKDGNYRPQDLLAFIELDRYRGGRCTGKYTSRLHHLEDWIYDNARRGLVRDLTRSLGGVPMTGHRLVYMGKAWRQFRYLRNDPSMVPEMRRVEERISARTIYHIPKNRVGRVVSDLRNGDVICITGTWRLGYTEHVGLAYRDNRGVLRFLHASRDERRVIVDAPLQQYLYRYRKFAGIMVARPLEAGTVRRLAALQ